MTKTEFTERRSRVRAWVVAILSIAIWLMLVTRSSDASANGEAIQVPSFIVAQVLGHAPRDAAEAIPHPSPAPSRRQSETQDASDSVELVAQQMQTSFRDQLVAGVSRPSVELEVHFDFDSDQLHSESGSQIAAAAEVLNRHFTRSHFRVAGYTDSAGSADYNQQLSERRAEAVWRELVEEYGVDAERLERVGYGEDDPMRTASDAERRRVELQIVHLTPPETF